MFDSIFVFMLILGAITYLAKAAIGQWMATELETHKANLQRAGERELIALRENLQREQLRMQISYGGIFEKQAEAILAMDLALRDLASAAHDFTELNPGNSAYKDACYASLFSAHNQYVALRVLLPSKIDEGIKTFLNRLYIAISDHPARVGGWERLEKLAPERFDELFTKTWTTFNVELRELREVLIAEMRTVLGAAAADGLLNGPRPASP